MLYHTMFEWVIILEGKETYTLVSLWSDENKILVDEHHRRQKDAEKETLDEWRVRYGYCHWSKGLTESSLD